MSINPRESWLILQNWSEKISALPLSQQERARRFFVDKANIFIKIVENIPAHQVSKLQPIYEKNFNDHMEKFWNIQNSVSSKSKVQVSLELTETSIPSPSIFSRSGQENVIDRMNQIVAGTMSSTSSSSLKSAEKQ